MIKSIVLRRAAFPLVLILSSFPHTALASTPSTGGLWPSRVFASQEAKNQSQDSGAQALVTEGREHLRAKRFDQAVEVLRRAVQLQPDLTVAHISLGSALMETGQLNEALAEMNRAVKLSPNEAHAYFGLGNVQGAMRRYTEAIEAYNQAVRLNPNYFGAYNNLGIAYGMTNRHAESAEAFRQAVRIEPNNAGALNGLGIAQFRLGRHDEGIETVKRAVRLDPKFVNAYLNLARWYQDLGRYEESADAFTEVTRIVPRFPITYFERSLDYLYLGRGEAAALDATKFLELTDWHSERAKFTIIIATLGYRRAGNEAAAKQTLDLAFQRTDKTKWPYPIIKYLRGELSASDLLALATNNNLMTEARAYIGMDLLLKDQKEEALAHFRWVKENGNRSFVEYKMAVAELGRIEAEGASSKP